MNIGIFGGTFNPPHMGHLIVVESIRDQSQFDKILFIPSSQPPNKRDSSVASAMDRLAMTQLAVRDNRDFEVSDIEIQRGGVSYSIDTINALASSNPKASLSLILGVDNLIEFSTWKSPKEILAKADLVVMSRPGFDKQHVKNEFARLSRFVHVPPVGISGTEIRRRIKMGRSIRYLVPKTVEDYILSHGLYL